MVLKHERSRTLFKKALDLLPGGVDSPVRAFRAVGGEPLFIERGEGPYLFDVDGNRYIDYVLSWGPLILGHADAQLVGALHRAAAKGTSFGAPSELELELARLVMGFMPGIEMIRFVTSGTEATMSALRLARAFTEKDKIIKFKGCYHGHADMLLVQAGSGVATLGLPDSPGVPKGAAKDTLVAGYNNLASVESLFEANQGEIAAVIIEPVAGNMGVVPPQDGFLQGLRAITEREGALLIFDEVMSGFRVHKGGAQELFDVVPDLTTLGKVIGGGLPVGAYGGKREMMEMVAPAGPMYQAGTLSGNPLAMTAGIETLRRLQDDTIWKGLFETTLKLADGLVERARAAGFSAQGTQVGSMMSLFFTDIEPVDWSSVSTSDTEQHAAYFKEMLSNGVYLAPSQFEAEFTSVMHDEQVIEATLRAAEKSFSIIRK